MAWPGVFGAGGGGAAIGADVGTRTGASVGTAAGATLGGGVEELGEAAAPDSALADAEAVACDEGLGPAGELTEAVTVGWTGPLEASVGATTVTEVLAITAACTEPDRRNWPGRGESDAASILCTPGDAVAGIRTFTRNDPDAFAFTDGMPAADPFHRRPTCALRGKLVPMTSIVEPAIASGSVESEAVDDASVISIGRSRTGVRNTTGTVAIQSRIR